MSRFRFNRSSRLITAGVLAAASLVTIAADSSANGATGKGVKIGIIATQGIPAENLTTTVNALKAGINTLNKTGGLHGHHITLVQCNDHGDATDATNCATTLAADKVLAVVGGGGYFGANTQPILAAAGIPEIAVTATSEAEFNGKNMFNPQAGQVAELEAETAYAGQKLAKPIIAVTEDLPTAVGDVTFLDSVLTQTADKAGFTDTIKVDPATADWAPVAQSIDADNPGTVIMLLSHEQELGLFPALASSGSTATSFVIPPVFGLSLPKTVGPIGNKIVTAQTYPPLSYPAMKPFVTSLKAAHGNINDVLSTDIDAWLGLKALNAVTKGLKTITPRTVTSALNKAKKLNLGAMVPAWTPNTPGPQGFSRFSNSNVWIIGISNYQQIALVSTRTTVAALIAGKF
jgi:ABC-type branched-subunit amino acid transport system substrate-binding protein